YRHKVSPYVGRTIGARITKTILRGDVIYDIEHGFPGARLMRRPVLNDWPKALTMWMCYRA
ncbi:hypothetical protein MJI95_25530, partial [Salmonella enterica subsp. enterica serovar Kentucky]|nr:hypothetical protein [Salmonella enterica subsp. enterica serovar Kentucky]